MSVIGREEEKLTFKYHHNKYMSRDMTKPTK